MEGKAGKSLANESNRSCSAALPRDHTARFSVKAWLHTEIIVLCIMVVIVWGLLSLPTIFYHLPEDSQQVTEVSKFYLILKITVPSDFCNEPDRTANCIAVD